MSYIYKHTYKRTHTHTHSLSHILNLLCGSAWWADLSALTETFCGLGISGERKSEAAGDPPQEFSLWFLSLKEGSASGPGARLKSQGTSVPREKGVSGAGARELGSCLGS